MKNGSSAKKSDCGKFESIVNLKQLLQLFGAFICEIPEPTLSFNIEVFVVKISNSNLE